jgi:hypothetical protein
VDIKELLESIKPAAETACFRKIRESLSAE